MHVRTYVCTHTHTHTHTHTNTELSEVLWTMVIQMAVGFGIKSPVVGTLLMFFLFAFWAGEWVSSTAQPHTYTDLTYCYVCALRVDLNQWQTSCI